METLDWTHFWLFIAAFFAGVLNSVAGGGSFLTFPALIFGGVNPIVANATSTVALFPASFVSAWAYRRELFSSKLALPIQILVPLSILGGWIGAVLLIKTSQSTFVGLIPYLLLFATLVFTFGKNISAFLQEKLRVGPGTLLILQFLVAIYGGYFGGGIGILMLAMMTLSGIKNIHAMNAMKTLLAGSMNAAAVGYFLFAHTIDWSASFTMVVGSILGGYIGAVQAQKIDAILLRRFIVGVAFAMTFYFFYKAH